MTATHLAHAAEIYAGDGPTGQFVEVTRGEVRDYGGNLLFAGTADECVSHLYAVRGPARLVPTEWKRAGAVAGADHTWEGVIA